MFFHKNLIRNLWFDRFAFSTEYRCRNRNRTGGVRKNYIEVTLVYLFDRNTYTLISEIDEPKINKTNSFNILIV